MNHKKSAPIVKHGHKLKVHLQHKRTPKLLGEIHGKKNQGNNLTNMFGLKITKKNGHIT